MFYKNKLLAQAQVRILLWNIFIIDCKRQIIFIVNYILNKYNIYINLLKNIILYSMFLKYLIYLKNIFMFPPKL